MVFFRNGLESRTAARITAPIAASLLLLLSCAGFGTAHAATPQTPHDIVAALYKPYLDDPHASLDKPLPGALDSLRPFAAPKLAAAIDADAACARKNGVCGNDADFLINGQDWDLSAFRISDGPPIGSKQSVAAWFKNGSPMRVTFFFVRIGTAWKVADVEDAELNADGQVKARWKLSASLGGQ